MSIVNLLKSDGPSSAAGTVLATNSPVEGAAWAEVASITAAIPVGGAMLEINPDSAAIRVAVMPPSDVARIPPHNGDIIKQGDISRRRIIPFGARVWTKQP